MNRLITWDVNHWKEITEQEILALRESNPRWVMIRIIPEEEWLRVLKTKEERAIA